MAFNYSLPISTASMNWSSASAGECDVCASKAGLKLMLHVSSIYNGVPIQLSLVRRTLSAGTVRKILYFNYNSNRHDATHRQAVKRCSSLKAIFSTCDRLNKDHDLFAGQPYGAYACALGYKPLHGAT